MGSTHAETHIARPVEEVWKVVGDFGGLQSYFPGIEAVRLEGNSRFIKMGPVEIQEDLVSKDDSAHELVYGVATGGAVPVTEHRAVIRVAAEGDGSKVTWDCDFAPDDLLAIFEPTYAGAVQALKAHCEG